MPLFRCIAFSMMMFSCCLLLEAVPDTPSGPAANTAEDDSLQVSLLQTGLARQDPQRTLQGGKENASASIEVTSEGLASTWSAGLADIPFIKLAEDSSPRSSPSRNSSLDVVHVVYATTMHSTGPGDEGLLATMISLSYSLAEPSRCVIHIIVPGEDMADALKVVDCFHSQFRSSQGHPNVTLHALKQPRFDIAKNAYNGRLAGVGTTFSRFYLPEYLPGVDRAIWIDTDTIVQHDVMGMYNITMTQPVAAVLQEDRFEHYKKFRDYIPKKYLNKHLFSAGILVADLARWREQNVTGMLEEQARSMLTFGQGLDDQLVLNLAFPEAVDSLDPRWNTELLGFNIDCWERPEAEAYLLHWSGPIKAWSECRESCAPFDMWKPQPRCGSGMAASSEGTSKGAASSIPMLPSEVYVGEALPDSTGYTATDLFHVVYATSMDSSSTGPDHKGLLASMLSLSRSLTEPHRCVIHLFVSEQDLEAAQGVLKCFEHQWGPSEAHAHLSVRGIRPPASSTSAVAASLVRLYLPEYLPNVDQVLWLDPDTIVQGDVRGMYEASLGYAMAAMELNDTRIGGQRAFHDIAPMKFRSSPLFDAGVFIADLRLWREWNVTAALEEQARAMVASGKGWDVGFTMNLVFHGDYFKLDPRWIGADLGVELECEEHTEAIVLHWSGPIKAWSDCRKDCATFDPWTPQVQCSAW